MVAWCFVLDTFATVMNSIDLEVSTVLPRWVDSIGGCAYGPGGWSGA